MPMIELSDGSTLLFSVAGQSGDFETQGPVVDKIKKRLTDVAGQVGHALLDTVTGLRSSLTTVRPSELEAAFSVSLTEEGSVVLFSGKTEASLTIKAVWRAGKNDNA